MRIKIVGAGLVGSLAAIYYARKGHDVSVHERRSDMRKGQAERGRSINLAMSVRGIRALLDVGLDQIILEKAIPMKGRMIHSKEGATQLQPYGRKDTETIFSISRAELNESLMTAFESKYKSKIAFEEKLTTLDFSKREATFETPHGTRQESFDFLIGCDGAFSAVRAEWVKQGLTHASESFLDYGYKELHISPSANPNNPFKMEKHALHIWPRGRFMLIALPNSDGSFTCTLFLAQKSTSEHPESFEKLQTPKDVQAFFETHFRDVIPLLDDLERTFFANPTGSMVTVRTDQWSMPQGGLLLGDAAHAIVPFYGQGMNCGFEDLTELEKRGGFEKPSATLYAQWSEIRKPDANAIANMAIQNFVEMRDLVADPVFLKKKEIEKQIESWFGDERYVSKYRLVSFSRTPYHIAEEIGKRQETLLKALHQEGQVTKESADQKLKEHFDSFFEKPLKGKIQWT